ncbi:MAG: hypothetical protein K6F00_09210 [Lachnospiraceae bacterium]|nr:hypothetical protein [Lachnospiraceae bacterium]
MDNINVDKLFEDLDQPTPEELELAEKIKPIFQSISDSYEKTYDINERLVYDDALADEFITAYSMLNLMEAFEEKHDDPEMLEHGYLKVIDCMIRMAKVIHPISGFGKDRLLAAYELLDTFEKAYYPLLTNINEKNIDAFFDLFNDKEYDEVYFGRKKAIGALRKEGSDTYAAGVIVYTIDNSPVFNAPVIRLDYIYVHEDFRSFGTANLLMAAVVRPMMDNPDASLIVSYKPSRTTDNDSEEYASAVEREFDLTEEFLSSWRLDFSLDYSKDVYVTVKDAGKSKFMDYPTTGIISLDELGEQREYILKKFFKKLDPSLNKEFLMTSVKYYEPDVSCVSTVDGNVSAALLCHRCVYGRYLVTYVSLNEENPDKPSETLMGMLHFAHNACVKKGDTRSMVEIQVNSEEGFELLSKLMPEAKSMLVFNGILSPLMPSETASSEEWEMLREEAGLTEKYKYDGDDISDISQEEYEKALEEHLKSYM